MAGVPFPFPFPSFSLSSPPPLLAAARKLASHAGVFGRLHVSQQFTVWYLAPSLYIQRHERKLKHSCEFQNKGAVLCSHAFFHEDTIE